MHRPLAVFCAIARCIGHSGVSPFPLRFCDRVDTHLFLASAKGQPQEVVTFPGLSAPIMEDENCCWSAIFTEMARNQPFEPTQTLQY